MRPARSQRPFVRFAPTPSSSLAWLGRLRVLPVLAFALLGLGVTPAAAQDCATTPPATCVGGVPTVASEVACFGCAGACTVNCPLGTEDAVWNSDPANGPVDAPMLQVRKFQPPPGGCTDLVQVDLTLAASADAAIRIENTANNPAMFDAMVIILLNATPVNLPGIPPLNLQLQVNQPGIMLPAFDGTIDFGGPSGRTFPPVFDSDSVCIRITNPALLAMFVDTTPANPADDFIVFNHSSNGSFSQTGGPDVIGGSMTRGNIQVQATYTSCQCLVTAVTDNARVCVGESVTIPVSANDTTTCGAINPASLVLNPSPGFSKVGNNIVYNAAGQTPGIKTATYTICNNQTPACCATGMISVEVCATVAMPDTRRMCSGNTVMVPVLANDSTSCGAIDPASLTLVAPVPPGFSVSGGQIVYNSTLGPRSGTFVATYRVCNNQTPACCAQSTLTVEVCQTQANDDTAFVCLGGSISIPVLANDTTSCGAIDPATLFFPMAVPAGFSIVGSNIVFNSALAVGNGPFVVTYGVGNNQTPICFDQATVTVSACAVDAVDDPAMICCGETAVVLPLANDTSTCGALSCAQIQLLQPIPAGFSVNGCEVRYNSALGPCTGTVMVRYRISAAGQATCPDEANIIITIKPRPTALDDNVVLPSGSAGPVDIDILANDTPGTGSSFPGCGGCPAGIPCANTIAPPPANGTVVVNADCTVTYTPNGAFTGSDQFCYEVTNVDGCKDQACVQIGGDCVPRHRRACGSLLLYPEFDNRQGVTTLLTVTNKNCELTGNPQVDNIDVEFVYINRVGCSEFNRVVTLTPCDTFTVLTRAHNPNANQGYVYVFARRFQNGPPVSYNGLIGQQLVLDGLLAFEYSVNAVAFESPLPQGALSDLNGNGLRDLDGLEYYEAPDEILIPRFIGQCVPGGGMAPPACVESKLILINLTGGAKFLTTVDFLIYNDNEQQFSAEYSFICWDDPKLLQISGVFANDFLRFNTLHDPEEIVGAPLLESGWFRFNGAIASSTVVDIPSPAVYGVLIERIGIYVAGDLPFELCSQTNGALLARNLLGNL